MVIKRFIKSYYDLKLMAIEIPPSTTLKPLFPVINPQIICSQVLQSARIYQ